MSRIEIRSNDHTVIVDHDGRDLAYLTATAMSVWEKTAPPERPAGPAVGFTSERRHTPDVRETNLGAGRHRAAPVNAAAQLPGRRQEWSAMPQAEPSDPPTSGE